jgi:hypothetical protein
MCGAGAGGFAWFADHTECATFIAEVLAADGPEGPTPDAASAAMVVLDEHGLTLRGLEELTALGPQSLAFEWAGPLEELLGATGDFVEKIRRQFRDDTSSAPITVAERQALLARLPKAGL